MTTLVALLLLTSSVVVVADKDANVYAFGQNPNVRSRSYWADSIDVVNDLSKFSALYIKSHGCVWSPNAAIFDDDGEYRDGDENWYQGRTSQGAANVGFSLYGIQKMSLSLRGCSKATYINSFFTTAGVEGLISTLGLNIDTSGAYCSAYYGNNDNRRELGSGSGDNNNQGQSSTLGCAADGSFATAIFNGDYCEGLYFLNTTDDGSYKSFNRAISNKIDCKRIWNGKSKETASGYNSLAEEVLLNSRACYLDVEPSCPDPYGKKSQYTKFIHMAESGRSVAFQSRFEQPLKVVSHLALWIGVALLCFSYCIRNQERIRLAGGGNRLKGLAVCAADDAGTEGKKACQSLFKMLRRALRDKKKRRRKRRSKKHQEDEDGIFRNDTSPSDGSELELPSQMSSGEDKSSTLS